MTFVTQIGKHTTMQGLMIDIHCLKLAHKYAVHIYKCKTKAFMNTVKLLSNTSIHEESSYVYTCSNAKQLKSINC